MLPKPESACFVIADISGYTSFLATVELEHAQDIIADLMDTVVRGLRPPFRLAKFEGDAAFLYAVTDRIDGSMLQDAVEGAYFAFRRRMRNIKAASSCECSACRTMHALDFKFVVHHGEMVKQKIAGHEELAGRDVILVHRLLKNAVSEKMDGHPYALYSEACVAAMGIDPAEHDLVEHQETIDIIGDVRCWIRDLEAAWAAELARSHTLVTETDAAAVFPFDLDAPRPAVWEYFTHPEHRPKWQGSDGVIEKPRKGRRGVGTTNHCMHGKDTIVEDILDWRPFDHVTLTTLLAPGAPKILMTYALTDLPGGRTHAQVRIGKAAKGNEAFLDSQVGPFGEMLNGMAVQLKLLLKERKGPDAAVEEPALLPTRGRFLSEPVHAR